MAQDWLLRSDHSSEESMRATLVFSIILWALLGTVYYTLGQAMIFVLVLLLLLIPAVVCFCFKQPMTAPTRQRIHENRRDCHHEG